MKQLFEIHVPGIDPEKLALELEKNFQSRSYDPIEVERVKNLSFTPVSPSGLTGFDPALTSDLYESPVLPPDFSSNKYRYLIGPLKIVARRLFNFFSHLFDKLSENKIQAFYNVVHELIALNYRHKILTEKFDIVLSEYLNLRAKFDSLKHDGNGSSRESASVTAGALIPPAGLSYSDTADTLALLKGIKNDERILLLDDRWGSLSVEIRRMGFSKIHLNAAEPGQYLFLAARKENTVSAAAADVMLSGEKDSSLQMIALPDLSNCSGSAEVVPSLAAQKLAPGGYLLFYFSPEPVSAVKKNPRYRIDIDKLAAELESLNCRVLHRDQSADGGERIIFQKV